MYVSQFACLHTIVNAIEAGEDGVFFHCGGEGKGEKKHRACLLSSLQIYQTKGDWGIMYN